MYSYIYTSEDRQHKTELYFSKDLPEKIHISSVRLFVLDANQRLLFIKDKSGIWDLPGGKVEVGESVDSAAIREVFEEAYVNISTIAWVAHEKVILTRNYHFTCYGIATVASLEAFVPNKETLARKFVNKEEAIEQDGILFGNRHVIFDSVILSSSSCY